MKNIKRFMLSTVMVVVLAAPAVYAQEQGKANMHNKHHEMFKQLNLTDDQKKQLDANKQKRKEEMKTFFEQMKSKREALRQELMKKDLDMAKVNDIQSQIKALEAQMSDARLNSILEVRKILTPEQFNKFISVMEHHPKMRFEGKKHSKNKDEKSE